ncbi:MAG: glucose/galactose MFS transporter [Proteobacteria bacterium]|nr:glucose/galactose MFS transporter [Pseudomonadota bacterium]
MGQSGAGAGRGGIMPLAIIGLLFFVFGFVTWLNGSLIPYLQIVCRLSAAQALLVTFAFYIAYTVTALPMAAILRRTGYRLGMALGMALMALGALLHIPAAWAASFPLFLCGLFVIGTGLTLLQAASNPYIVLLGPLDSAPRRIAMMGIINKSAGVLAPLAFAGLVASGMGDARTLARATPDAAQVARLAQALIGPYLAMAAILAGLVAFLWLAPLPEIEPEPAPDGTAGQGLSRFPQLTLGVITLFGYVGVEVLAGDTIGLFGQSLHLAGFVKLTAYTMGFMVAGYILGAVLIPRWLRPWQALAGSGLLGLACMAGAALGDPGSTLASRLVWGWLGLAPLPDPVFFVAAMGLANAVVWPAVWPMALRNLGSFTATGSALLIMAISGGAIIPQLFGLIARSGAGMQLAYLVAAPCYAMILAYALIIGRRG